MADGVGQFGPFLQFDGFVSVTLGFDASEGHLLGQFRSGHVGGEQRGVRAERGHRQSGCVFEVSDTFVAEHVAHSDGFAYGVVPDDERSVFLVDHGPGRPEDHRCIADFESFGRISVANNTSFGIVERDNGFLSFNCD